MSVKCKICGADDTEQKLDRPPGGDENSWTCVNHFACVERAKDVGRKDDRQKPRMSLVPKGTIAAVLRVLEFGAKKYGPGNWSKVDNARERYYNAGQRHLEAWWAGESADDETGESHLAHLICCAMFLLGKEIAEAAALTAAAQAKANSWTMTATEAEKEFGIKTNFTAADQDRPTPSPCATPGCTLYAGPGAQRCVVHTATVARAVELRKIFKRWPSPENYYALITEAAALDPIRDNETYQRACDLAGLHPAMPDFP